MAEYIDRETAIALCDTALEKNPMSCAKGIVVMRDLLIYHAPAADVALIVHAHWTLVAETPHFCIDECSACHGRTIDARAYCPNCGAKMDESEEDDNG